MVTRKALHDLLCELFADAGQLRRFLCHGDQGEAIVRELPGVGVPLAEQVDRAIDELMRRGLVTAAMECLRTEFPLRRADIDRVAGSTPRDVSGATFLGTERHRAETVGTSAPGAPGPVVTPPIVQTDDVALLIALKEEWDVLLPIAGSPRGVKDVVSGRYVYRFEVPSAAGRPYRCVAVCMGDMGPGQATDATHLLLQTAPRTLVNLGIAAAIHDDLKLCDVVVAEQVDDYLATVKAAPRGKNGWSFELRGSVYKPTYSLVQDVDNLKDAHPEAFAEWRSACAGAMAERAEKLAKARKAQQLGEAPALARVHLASGPVLAASEAFVEWVRTRDGLLKALEMEAAGMMLAAHQRSVPTSTLVLRGISDFGDSRKSKTDRKSGGAFRYLAMFNATQLLWAMMRRGLLARHEPGRSSEGSSPTMAGNGAHGREHAAGPSVSAPRPVRPPWDAKKVLMDALRSEPNAIVHHIDVHLGGKGRGIGESSQEFAARVAAAIDALGEGPRAAVALINACSLALSDVGAVQPDRPGAKRILRALLGEWLPHRYGCSLATTPRIRSSEEDAVEDLEVGTPRREIAEPAIAYIDGRRSSYHTRTIKESDGGMRLEVGPRGELPISDALWAEILTSDDRGERIAHSIADQIPSPAKTTPERKLEDTREWLAFLREPGEDRDPRHLTLTATQRERLGEDALVRLKAFFPALRLVELGDRAGAEETKIRFRLLSIFKDDV
jgi:nucleoside phosphorylase